MPSSLYYLSADQLHEAISKFTTGMAVTLGKFELLIPECSLDDFEWNHMDQLHRPSIHQTYEKGIRLAFGENFAISLTQWKKWPLFITVTDVYVKKGVFYQSMTLAGLIFLHCIINVKQVDEQVQLKVEWYIASHKWLKFLHKPLSKKLYRLNQRLQVEDAQIRNERFKLRKDGFQFKYDPANYYTSNMICANTIYPPLSQFASLAIEDFSTQIKKITCGGLDFLIQRVADEFLIWPAVCPHEGGPLDKGKLCGKQIICPWHSLKFNAVVLSTTCLQDHKYGFEFKFATNKIHIQAIPKALSTVVNINQ
jgi:hypothetical protein